MSRFRCLQYSLHWDATLLKCACRIQQGKYKRKEYQCTGAFGWYRTYELGTRHHCQIERDAAHQVTTTTSSFTRPLSVVQKYRMSRASFPGAVSTYASMLFTSGIYTKHSTPLSTEGAAQTSKCGHGKVYHYTLPFTFTYSQTHSPL